MSKILKLWLPVLLSMSGIFIASSISGESLPSALPFQDIAFHLLAYSTLGYFFLRALKKSFPGPSAVNIIILTTLFGLFYGLTDEFHQSFIPYRSVSALDLFFDGLGSLAGSLLYRG